MKMGLILTLFLGVCAWSHGADSVPAAESLPPGVKKLFPIDPNDPLQAQFYQLENGLTIALSVNPETPRIQTLIGVRAGALQDPLDKTGLAHYLEHLLFKGSEHLGTTDFKKEKVLLDRIDDLYEQHEKLTNPAERQKIYLEIDRLSGEAAQYSVANEYMNAVQLMGADGTNAYTSLNRTVYINDIPANQFPRWIMLEYDRFLSPVFRGFHTELETVYEECNMSQDNISRRFWYFVSANLYGDHPYGRPVIGLPEHLKNPSPRAVMQYYRTWYVPNNMIISLAGDLDPHSVLQQINALFGTLPARPLPTIERPIQSAPKGEQVREITVPDHEMVMMLWRLDNPSPRMADLLEMTASVMYNGAAGLLDQNLNIPQKVTSASANCGYDSDLFGTFSVSAIPNTGVTPEAARLLLEEQIAKLKAGDFPDWLPEAIVRQRRLSEINALDSNDYRADRMLGAFLDSEKWSDIVQTNDRLSRITKTDIQSFAQQYLGKDRFVFYRRNGSLTQSEKLPKPGLTPLPLRPEAQSEFMRKLKTISVGEIKPQFPDLIRDVSSRAITLTDTAIPFADTLITAYRRVNVTSVRNLKNDFFSLRILYRNGNLNDSVLSLAGSYAGVAGTTSKRMEEIKLDLYRLAGEIGVSVGDEESSLNISGLNADFDELLALAVTFLDSPRLNSDALAELNKKILLSRKMAKEKPQSVLSALQNYAKYGLDNPINYILTENELAKITPETLIRRLQDLRQYPARILYYGPKTDTEISAAVAGLPENQSKYCSELFPLPENRARIPRRFTEQNTDTRVIFVNMPNFRQVQMFFLRLGGPYRKDDVGTRMLFNAYYGVGMGSVTFQNLREANSLCYGCQSWVAPPNDLRYNSWYQTYLTTQADKMNEAIQAVTRLGFPVSLRQIESAKTTLLKNQAAERWFGPALLDLVELCRKMNLPPDYRQFTYERIGETSAADLVNFYRAEIDPVPATLLIIGDKSLIDMKSLEHYGPVTEMTIEQILPLY